MTLDRYIFQELAKPFAAVFLTVVALMSIEHLPALLDLARNVGDSRRFVALSIVALLPEYAAIALILALFLAVALTVRKLALNSELDALRAAGFSDIRILRVPAMLGLVVGAALLVIRFEAQPLGERELIAVGDQMAAGDFGINIDPRRSIRIGPDATLHIDAVSKDRRSLSGLLITTGDKVIAAETGAVALDSRGQVVIGLKQGRMVTHRGSALTTSAGFANLKLVLPGLQRRPAKVAESDRRASLTFGELRTAIAASAMSEIRRPYEGVLCARLAIGIIVMLLPWPAFVLGLPTRRHASGIGFAIGITMIVAIVRTTSSIDGAGSTDPRLYGLCVTTCWAFLFMSLFVINRRFGDGFAERFALSLSGTLHRRFGNRLTRLVGSQET